MFRFVACTPVHPARGAEHMTDQQTAIVPYETAQADGTFFSSFVGL
jgi:hypothetical protein